MPQRKYRFAWTSPLVFDRVDRHVLYLGAQMVLRTRDGGLHWQVISPDLTRAATRPAATDTGPTTVANAAARGYGVVYAIAPSPRAAVRDLAVHGPDLVVATHGRSFWILDDLTPLRQLADSALRAPAHLFAPARAVRLRRSVSNDTPLPPEEPHGANPPAGAVIDYLLGSAPAGSVTLEIRDARGALVRRFSSDDRAAPPPEPPQIADEWLPRAEPPTRHVGLNRFVWDLRYPPPPAERHDYSIAATAGSGTGAGRP